MREIKKCYTSAAGNIRQYITHENIDELAPFVLFDALTVNTSERWGFPWHSHSGVATLTFPYSADLDHKDTGGNNGIIPANGFQWMAAGGGIWHSEYYQPHVDFVGAHQLWIQLPPEEEEQPVKYVERTAEEIPHDDNTRVLIGEYENNSSSAKVPADMTYLDVSLKKDEVWHFSPPVSQIRGFVFSRKGRLKVGDSTIEHHVFAMFIESEEAIEIRAVDDTDFIVALVAPSPYELVHEYGQMHTNKDALERSKTRIKKIGAELKEKNIIK